MKKWTFMAYNPSRNFSWVAHKAGCRDIQMELKGVHTDSGWPASDPEDVEANTYEEAAEKYLGEEMKEMGWTIDDIRKAPCC